ncbi:hypothetical protein Ocin01_04272, partial [Orchesella cincta]
HGHLSELLTGKMKFNKLPMVLILIILTISFMEVNCHDEFRPPCKYPIQQVYSTVKEKCVSLVGGHCDMLETSGLNKTNTSEYKSDISKRSKHMECIQGAECLRRWNYPFPHCVCHSSLRTSRSRKCVLGFGDPCDNHNKELMCDESKLLTCVNWMCQCHEDYNHEYDEYAENCVGKVGAFCKISKRKFFNGKLSDDGRDSNDQDPYAVLCTNGAACALELAGESFGNGVCACWWMYNVTANGTCEYMYKPRSTETTEISTGNKPGLDYALIIFLVTAMMFVLIFAYSTSLTEWATKLWPDELYTHPPSTAEHSEVASFSATIFYDTLVGRIFTM